MIKVMKMWKKILLWTLAIIGIILIILGLISDLSLLIEFLGLAIILPIILISTFGDNSQRSKMSKMLKWLGIIIGILVILFLISLSIIYFRDLSTKKWCWGKAYPSSKGSDWLYDKCRQDNNILFFK
jgi:hypothetical protein